MNDIAKELIALRHKQATKIARLAKIAADLVEIDAQICAAARAAACKACDDGLIDADVSAMATEPKDGGGK